MLENNVTIIKHKVDLLNLAKELVSVSKALLILKIVWRLRAKGSPSRTYFDGGTSRHNGKETLW